MATFGGRQMVDPTALPGLGMQNVFSAPISDGAGYDMNFEEYEPFEDLKFDVTNLVQSIYGLLFCPCFGWTSKTLLLGDQEVIYKNKNLCYASTQKRPYAKLGSVEKLNNACCVSFSSAFAPFKVNDKGQVAGGMSPGFGCDEELVNEIVTELQHRKLKRGSIAQMRKLEFMMDRIVNVARQVPIVMDKMGGLSYKLQYPPVDQKRQVFPTKKFDVSMYCELLSCTSRELELGPEEALYTVNKCFGMASYTRKREYSELGFVQASKKCIFCRAVDSDLTGLGGEAGEAGEDMSPGCGCQKTKVNEIVQEMRNRMSARGDVGQTKKLERMYQLMVDIDNEMPMAMQKLRINYPPSQAIMQKMYAGDVPDISMLQEQGVAANLEFTEQFETKEFDITNTWEKLGTCLSTFGAAGCTKKTLELQNNMVIITERNNFDDSSIHMPYHQIDSVDVDKNCCCLFSVNEESPGFGCDRELVEEIAEDLQERKTKRGNIAQLMQLQAMQSSSLELDVQMDLIMKAEGIAYPPSQATIQKVWRGQTPYAIAKNVPPPHVEAAKEFETVEYDITNYQECCCACVSCCGPLRSHLTLDSEQMHIEKESWCTTSNQRIPYAQLGSVEVEEVCLCCHQLPEVANPGCGCNEDLVTEIAEELQERKDKRGLVAQFKMQENVLHSMLKVDAKTDLWFAKHGVSWPPTQEVMARVLQMPNGPAGADDPKEPGAGTKDPLLRPGSERHSG